MKNPFTDPINLQTVIDAALVVALVVSVMGLVGESKQIAADLRKQYRLYLIRKHSKKK